MLYILDKVLNEIDDLIVSHSPERGGALLGLIEKPVVTHFLFDEHATTTRSTYRPSVELAKKVKEIELAENLEYKGIIHSHPGFMDHPSAQDQHELNVGLNINPHMTFYLVPIVTTFPPRSVQAHELSVGKGKISFFVAYRKSGGGIDVIKKPTLKIPLLEDLERIKYKIDGTEDPEVFLTEFENRDVLAGRLSLGDDREIMLIANDSYPAMPPIILLTENGNTEQIAIAWPLDIPQDQRLLHILERLLITNEDDSKETGDSPLT